MTDDIFVRTRTLFELPEGVVYLDGNSLGPLPIAVRERVLAEIDQGWGERLIRGWNDRGWIDLSASRRFISARRRWWRPRTRSRG